MIYQNTYLDRPDDFKEHAHSISNLSFGRLFIYTYKIKHISLVQKVYQDDKTYDDLKKANLFFPLNSIVLYIADARISLRLLNK